MMRQKPHKRINNEVKQQVIKNYMGKSVTIYKNNRESVDNTK